VLPLGQAQRKASIKVRLRQSRLDCLLAFTKFAQTLRQLLSTFLPPFRQATPPPHPWSTKGEGETRSGAAPGSQVASQGQALRCRVRPEGSVSDRVPLIHLAQFLKGVHFLYQCGSVVTHLPQSGVRMGRVGVLEGALFQKLQLMKVPR